MNLHDKEKDLYDEKCDKVDNVLEETENAGVITKLKEDSKKEKTANVEDIQEDTTAENIQSLDNEEDKKDEKKSHDEMQKDNNKKNESEQGTIDNNMFKTANMPIKKNKKALIIVVTLILLILIMLSTGFALININNTKIIAGISINGIKVEGLTKEEATNKLLKEYENRLKQEITVVTTGFEYPIIGEQLEIRVNVEKAVEEAYNLGRYNNIFANNFNIAKTLIYGKDISTDIEYNVELLETLVSDIKAKLPNALIENSYEIQDNKLIITRGKEGNSIDIEELKEQIILAVKNSINKITLNTVYLQPEEINIEKIYEEVHSEPKDAYYTTDPFEIFPHKDGIDFDIEKAKEVLKEPKDSYEIEITVTIPKITTNQIGTEAFPNLLSSFTTKYDSGLRDRSTNLVLATEALDGTVVMPGEIFSYNKTLGERTVAKGYKQAAGFAGGKVVQTLGGGICQISSTVYDAAVYANLEIIERHNHAFLTSYIGAGKDATVVYGALDFRFKNTRKYPIMIKASASGGIAKVEIYGVKEETEYEIEITSKTLSYISYKVIYEDDTSMAEGQQKVTQNGMNGCKSITYKIYKLNGAEVKRETLSTDTYNAMNKYITIGVPTTIETVAPAIEETKPIIEENKNNTEQQQDNETENNQEQSNTQEEPVIPEEKVNEEINNVA